MSNATKKYPTRARISLDLFTSIFLSPKTVLATEEATCKYPRGRGREVGQGGEEGHRDGGGRAKDREDGRREEWRREGREGSIRSRSHVTAGGPWCFPDTTRGFRTRHWFQKGTREQRKSRVSVCVQSIHFRTMEKCLIRGGRGHQEREERGCVLPWNITCFASSERGFLKMPQALGRGESRSCILEFQGQKRSPDRQHLCAAMQFGKSGRDRLQPGGTPGSKGQEKLTQRWGLPRVAVERRGHLLR